MNKLQITTAILMLFLVLSCTQDEIIDDEKPVIDLSVTGAFPLNCDTVYIGETCTIKVRFTDNVALGSFGLDIHHNFDHHSHSTAISNCAMDPKKTPGNPFIYIQNYSIPDASDEYLAHIDIEIPDNVDPGDYHLMIRLTDKEGWQSIKGIAIKLATQSN